MGGKTTFEKAGAEIVQGFEVRKLVHRQILD
jgi:hypothetical protein